MRTNKPLHTNHLRIGQLVKSPYIRSIRLYQWSDGAASRAASVAATAPMEGR